ncbi:hypothetical protein [Microbacterium sp. CIAB417]|uniref:hypothetical protein n=1 Tax=Microbacterium sp. CIAB417 TaxID=2860287 RepID=UPI001FAC1E15|nr:hypothetical protein [Microbacterium sp. CIAB417]
MSLSVLPGLQPDTPRNETRTRLAQAAALVVTFLIGMRIDVDYGLTIGGVAAVALAPVWFGTLLRSAWSRALVALALTAALAGVLLTTLNAADHSAVTANLIERSIEVVQLGVLVAFLVWAYRVTSVARVCVAFASGLAAAIPLHFSADPNVWRFTLSIPLGVLVLAICSLTDRLIVTLTAVVALAAVGLVNDSRSNSAFLLLTGVVILWQRLSVAGSRRARGWGGILSLLAAGLALALLLQGAILEGYFGEVTRTRTAEQIERGGSVIVGGRPEIAASLALISRYPWGLGSGLRANYDDVLAAKTAMSEIGYDPDNGYVERFMFGAGIELHSVIGDLWIWFGLVGVALVALVLVLLILATKRGYAAGALTPLLVYLILRALWDLPFSPFDSAMRLWPLTLALSIAYATCRFSRPRADLHVLIPVLAAQPYRESHR